jgi:hypothetical protein
MRAPSRNNGAPAILRKPGGAALSARPRLPLRPVAASVGVRERL